MSRTTAGWLFVAAQAAFLTALVLFPAGDDWPMPTGLAAVSTALVILGMLVAVVAVLNLGRALTPTPVPNGRGQLRTDGLYRLVRHPIYTGVLGIVVGLTLGTRHWAGLGLGLSTVMFFWAKARWEEARLAEAFPGYAAYAAGTPRFVPSPRSVVRTPSERRERRPRR